MDGKRFWGRLLQAAKLDGQVYEEVEADKSAMGQALAVVLLSSIAAGLGSLERVGLLGLLVGTLAALIGWFIWAWLAYIIGTKLLPEPETRADYGELLRTIGFASSPGLIRVVGIIPGVAALVNIIAAFWMLVAMVVAVKHALDYQSTFRAIAVCLIGWLIQVGLLALIYAIAGGGGPATG